MEVKSKNNNNQPDSSPDSVHSIPKEGVQTPIIEMNYLNPINESPSFPNHSIPSALSNNT